MPLVYGALLPSKTEDTGKKTLDYQMEEIDKLPYNAIFSRVFLDHRTAFSQMFVSLSCGVWCHPFSQVSVSLSCSVWCRPFVTVAS